MDKPLFNKNKNENTPTQDTTSPVVSAEGKAVPIFDHANVQIKSGSQFPPIGDQAIGAYGPQANRQLITQKTFNELAKQSWMEDTKIRAGLIFLSRSIAAGAFVIGGKVSKQWMKGYDASKSFMEQKQHNPGTFWAKFVDNCIGKPIYGVVKFLKNEEAAVSAVHFRPANHAAHLTYGGKHVWGRSLGEESVILSFDFYSMSVVNAAVQDIIQCLDPHAKYSWMDDQGNFKPFDAAKTFGKSWWRYLSYNGGEDLAVCAFAYPYALRAISSGINKASPNFKYISDAGLYSGGFKLSNKSLPVMNGAPNPNFMPEIAGTWRKENAMDFQLRFMAYNGAMPFGTIHFREVYNHVANLIQGKPTALYGSPDEKSSTKGVVGNAVELAKWSTRGMIKATLAMAPTVPFFWLGRVNGELHNGLFTHEKYGKMTQFDEGKGYWQSFTVSDIERDKARGIDSHPKSVWFSKYNGKFMDHDSPYTRVGPIENIQESQGHKRNMANPAAWPDPTDPKNRDWTGSTFHPYKQSKSILGKIADKFGSIQNRTVKHLTPYTGKEFANGYAKAFWSYPYYFAAKDFFGRTVDTNHTDMGLEKTIDGVVSGDIGAVKAGLNETWEALTEGEFSDPKREAMAKRRMQLENHSASDEFTDHSDTHEQHKSELKWHERIISNKIKGGDGASLEALYKRKENLKSIQKPELMAEREEFRKALEEHEPPTNAIN